MRHGFSLVELSIVLVILGLLTGGILTGQSLIRAAELRSVTTQLQQVQTAMYTFRDKYFALPGDMPNATRFWPAAGGTGTGSACFTADASGGKSCDGNSDGQIRYAAGANTSSDVWRWGERFHIWVHLANAGLMEGSYTGKTAGTGSFDKLAGGNLPAGKISNMVLDVHFTGGMTGSTEQFINTDKVTILSTMVTSSNDGPFTPEEVWNIDTKLDDGLPGQGKVSTTKQTSPSSPNCSTSDSEATAKYNLNSSISNCRAYIKVF